MLPAAATLLLGLALLTLGLRGRRINTHPICRNCSFDLWGLTNPEREQAVRAPSIPRCPECGLNLRHPHALQIGARKRSPTTVVLGVTITTLGLVAFLVSIWADATRFDWNRIKPDWWLAHKLTRGSRDQGMLEAAEKRLAAGTFRPAFANQIIEYALSNQAQNSGAEWDPRLGDVIEAAHAGKLASPKQWGTYVERLLPAISLVQRGDRVGLPFVIFSGAGSTVKQEAILKVDGCGPGGASHSALAVICELSAVWIGDLEVPAEQLEWASPIRLSASTTSWSTTASIVWADDRPGPHHTVPTKTRWRLQVIDPAGVVLAETDQVVPTKMDTSAIPLRIPARQPRD